MVAYFAGFAVTQVTGPDACEPDKAERRESGLDMGDLQAPAKLCNA
jgi:hypothetical protein